MSIQEGAKFLERPNRAWNSSRWSARRSAREHLNSGRRDCWFQRSQDRCWLSCRRQHLRLNMDRLRYLDDVMPPNVNALYMTAIPSEINSNWLIW